MRPANGNGRHPAHESIPYLILQEMRGVQFRDAEGKRQAHGISLLLSLLHDTELGGPEEVQRAIDLLTELPNDLRAVNYELAEKAQDTLKELRRRCA